MYKAIKYSTELLHIMSLFKGEEYAFLITWWTYLVDYAGK